MKPSMEANFRFDRSETEVAAFSTASTKGDWARRGLASLSLTALMGLGATSSALAQGDAAAPGGVSPWLGQAFLFGSFGLIFYFLIVRPGQKRQKAAADMLGSLKSGDKVVTTGGLIGTITDLRDDRVVLKIANDVKAEFTKASVTGKIEG